MSSATATEAAPLSLQDAARTSAAWPFEQARQLVQRIEKTGKQEVLFETGYGPSGLPHIGTFGEVARTTMVRHAFEVLTEGKIRTRLIAFSDDMDGLRKVPDNIPNKELVAAHLGKPLTRVPDPFGTHESFGAHNNARLRAFLDAFGFDYKFASATEYYTSGRFDAALLRMLARYDAIMKIMLPSFREERAATYSPFLPVHPETGIVMQVPIDAHDAEAGTITWRDPASGEIFTTPVTGGHCKLQWKPDWAMRWYALGVDYEMAGKDLIDSIKLSGQIVRALGGTPPEGFNYELFLDEKGQKISKSRGNGLSMEEWLTYASPESLSLFMYQKPTAAKRLYFDVVPRTVDDYLTFLDAYPRQDWKERLGNPVWHIHDGDPPPPEHIGKTGASISFGMLLNLATVANSEHAGIRGSTSSCITPCAISAISSGRRRHIVRPTTSNAMLCRSYRQCWLVCRPMQAPRPSRPHFMMSRGRSRATRILRRRLRRRSTPAFRTIGSTCSTRCCSAKIAGRVSARSSRFMGSNRHAS
jgi:lysyl-tRNA synthetase class 1